MQSLLVTLFILLLAITTSAAWASAKKYVPAVPNDHNTMTYTVTCRAGKSPGGAVFLNHIGTVAAKQAMSSATQFVWNLFNETRPGDRRNVKKIALFIDSMKGDTLDAYTAKNEIHVNSNFLGKYKGNIRREFFGIVYHQVTRVLQWNGGKEAPSGLLTGIAEFVRMEAHYGTTEKVKRGEGKQWDQGYGVTARFLEHCETTTSKKGFVRELNKKLRYGYTKAYFVEILGKPVDQIWKEYKAKYAKH